jgi:hypothetical protein
LIRPDTCIRDQLTHASDVVPFAALRLTLWSIVAASSPFPLQGTALLMVQSKLRPLRDIFPSHASVCGSQAGSSLNSVDGTIVLQEGSSREQHAHHSKHKQQRCPGQCQQPRTAPGAASPLQQEEVAAQQQEQQQRVPCAGQQQHCCQHDKQASPKQQQLQATSAASAPVAIRATQQQQQQYPAPEQQLQQSPACCVMAKQQVAPEDKQQQHQAPAVSTTPVQSKLDAEQQQLKLQQQQQGKEDSLPEAVPPQPWWKCLVFCS